VSQLQISEENVFTRLADVLTFRDIEFESDEFNRRFNVKGPDQPVRHSLLRRAHDGSAPQARGRLRLRDRGPTRLLCWCKRVAPAEMVHVLGAAKTFREQIPAVVSSLYPKG
jgi:hypothetical protein